MIVLKFGGTSVKDAAAFERVLDIVTNNQETSYICGNEITKLIVLSASSGITDTLISLVENAVNNKSDKVNDIFSNIRKRQFEIIDGLIPSDNSSYFLVKTKIESLLNDLKSFVDGLTFFGEASLRATDYAISFGELFSTTIFNHLLLSRGINNIWLDARKLLRTDSNHSAAIVDYKISRSNIEKIYAEDLINGERIAVTQGFIGSDFENHTTTLGRGGSDFSAAIFGKLFKADEIQIWTDVDGVLTADPRLVENTITISEMGFDEVRALAYFGAKVLHPQTLIPAVEDNIPVLVLNSLNKNHSGTTILHEIDNQNTELHSVVKINANRVTFSLAKDENASIKAIEILEIFNTNSIKIFTARLLPDSLIIWFENTSDLENDFDNVFEFDYEIDKTKTLLGIVGQNMNLFKFENELLSEISFDFVSINESRNTILISVPKDNGNSTLEIINQYIIKSNCK